MTSPDTTAGPRLVYLGSPALSVPPLRALHDAGFDVATVVTNPDRRRGRGSGTAPTPVKAAAVELGIPVTHEIDAVLDVGADLGVVVAFGQIIRPHVLGALPMVNLHFSLLPRWRGAAPVERAILAGDTRTGVDLMDVAEGLDTGAIRARVELDIGPDETADDLRTRLVDAGASLLVRSLRDGLPAPRPQEGEAVYAHKITPDDLCIDWDASTAQIHRQVRVGGAWTTRDGERFKVWRTSTTPTGAGIVHPTGDGDIELLEVQPAGKPRLDAAAWANGARWTSDDRLGS
ncbi:methionyl-tRNA formyltransferase [Actinospongicola halichondriae]|uniref:methionyl-tRNA formyltransferase n=1 Tax=Actinospongicola halichondriae TaxID=3236844 RepID=UPI003D44E3BB